MKLVWFAGFTAAFAGLAAWVFWGTWSPDFAPVMPDNSIVHSPYEVSDWWRGWLSGGKFVPSDVIVFLGSGYLWQELKYVLACYCAALGMAYYCRGRGFSRLAAYGAGLMLAFCGYWCTLFSAGHFGWFQWMTYGVFAFGLCDRAVRKGRARHWILLGATMAWGSFYQSDLWLLFSVLTGLYFVWCCVRERVFPRWKGLLLAALFFAVIGAPSFRSAFVNDLAGRDRQIAEGQTLSAQTAEQADDGERRWVFVTNWSLPPEDTVEFFRARVHGDTSCPFTQAIGNRYGRDVRPYTGALGRAKDAPSGNYRQHSLYVGFLTCLLAAVGLAAAVISWRRGRLRDDVVFFAVAAVVFWLFSLGRYCECVYRLVYALPFGDYLRAPVKWHHLTEFSLVVLAASGVEAVLGRLRCLGRLAPWIVGAVVLIGAIDLARVDRVYCAPVDLREARRQNSSLQMTFLRRSDFENPQVAALVAAKRIVPLANPNPEIYLVGVLQPWGPKNDEPLPPFGIQTALGLLSLLATLSAAAFAVKTA